MKIIDEKGKLFGKINIIDLLVVLLVVLLVISVAAARILQGAENDTEKEDSEDTAGVAATLTYKIRVNGIDPLAYETVHKFVDPSAGARDQIFSSDSNKLIDAFVIDCEATPHVEYVATEDGQVKRVESSGDDKRLDLIFTLQAEVKDSMTNVVGLQQVRVGVEHYIKTTHFQFVGYVLNADWVEHEAEPEADGAGLVTE